MSTDTRWTVARLTSEQAALNWLSKHATDDHQYTIVQLHIIYR